MATIPFFPSHSSLLPSLLLYFHLQRVPRLQCDSDLDRWRCDTNKTLTKTMRAVSHHGCGSLVQWTRTRSLHVASGFPSQQEPLDLQSAKHDIPHVVGQAGVPRETCDTEPHPKVLDTTPTEPRHFRQRHDRLQQWCTTDEHEDESAAGECISYYKVILNYLPAFRGVTSAKTFQHEPRFQNRAQRQPTKSPPFPLTKSDNLQSTEMTDHASCPRKVFHNWPRARQNNRPKKNKNQIVC